MPVVKTKGSASSQGFGEFAQQGGGGANYIDDVFSTYLYTGNDSTQTITNGIDLSTKGGLVWTKSRSGAIEHGLVDTVRGYNSVLSTNSTSGAWDSSTGGISSFGASGYSIGNYGFVNTNGTTYASWTFRKQAKFFDVVTFTGTGTTQLISHSLGSAPGCVIMKATSGTGDWGVWHRGNGGSTDLTAINLNTTNASGATNYGEAAAFNASTIDVNKIYTYLGANNTNGVTFVAYLFAHDAGGFGLTGTDNVVSCGSYTGNSTSGVAITLGYEPQWVMIKRTDSTGNWTMIDTMRGFPVGSNDSAFWANTTNAELSGQAGNPTATGFYLNGSWSDVNAPGGSYIYIAIRRPMKPPTTGTEVFSPIASSASSGTALTTNFPVDLNILRARTTTDDTFVVDRLRGVNTPNYTNSYPYLKTDTANAESSYNGLSSGWDNVKINVPPQYDAVATIYWNFRRASTFFDVVCYTGDDSSSRLINHNLGVIPELIIVKARQSTQTDIGWKVFDLPSNSILRLNSSDQRNTAGNLYGGFPNNENTTTLFKVISYSGVASVNYLNSTYVAYLFATCPGVSKVGSYTGTGTVTQTINAGFGASGARWVLIKRTDSTGGWYVFDTARGFTSTSSPYLLMNSTAAQVTGDNGCYAASTGFTLTTNASATVNVNGASYIYLAVA